jgi:parallel beta-helix repeat protein
MKSTLMPTRLSFLFLLMVAGCGGGGGGGGGGNGGESGVIYVRASVGNDNNRGNSPESALRSIQAAVDMAGRGETVVVGPGRYVASSGDIVVNVDGRGGGAGEPIEIVGDVNGSRTGDPPGVVTVDAAGRAFAFRFTNSSGFVLDSLTITGVAGNNAAGVHIRTDSRNITVRNCEIAGNGGDGVRIETSSDILLFNNLVHANAARGIQLGSQTVDTRLINNTVALNNNDGISGSGGGSRDIFLRNNAVYQNQNRGIDIRESALNGYNADYNLVFQRAGISVAYGPETPRGANDVNLEPLFANGFYLSQTVSGQRDNSPAVNAGDPGTDLQLVDSLHARTTKTNLDPDMGVVDIGYHYPGLFEPPPTRTLPMGTTPPDQVTPTPPASTTLYVRTSGSDAADGRSPSTALRTLQAAADRAARGNEIVVGPGIYGSVAFRAGADPERPIILRANPRGDRTGDDPGDVLIDAGAVGSAVLLDAAPYVIVDGFRITNSAAPGVQIRRGSHGAELRNCEVFDNAEDAIRIQDSDDVVVFNNLAYCNLRRGVLVGGALGSNRNQLINNTIAQNGDRGVFIGNSEAASKNTFMRNNIIQNNGVAELQVVTQTANSLEGFDNDYNMVFDEVAGAGQYNGASPGANDILAPAGFVDIASCDPLELHADDYRLAQLAAGQSPASPGIDTGDPATDPRFSAPLQQRTTATSNALDALPIDMGFHFLP